MEGRIYHRNLTQEETEAVKQFRIPGFIKTGKIKAYEVEVKCKTCKDVTNEVVIMEEFSDGSWLKQISNKGFDFSLEDVQTISAEKEFCKNCSNTIDKKDIISYYKQFIQREYTYIIQSNQPKTKSPLAVYETVIAAACRIAYFEGDEKNWEKYLPKKVAELIGSQKKSVNPLEEAVSEGE